jgi:hypothetical protein
MHIGASFDSVLIARRVVWISAAVIIVLILVLGGALLVGYNPFFPRIGSGYQAVFLTNGQAYFGKLTVRSLEYIQLQDVYYLVANPQANDSAEADRARKSQLVKLGSEVHGPLDVMYIPTKQILFWENLKDDSQVVQAILKQQ